jgi:methylmalonyl-CoA mutase
MSATAERLFSEFPPVSTAEWEAAIQKDLKGADYAKKLLWQTEEGITVKPYYRSEDIAGLQRPPCKATADWAICEEIGETDPKAANAAARAALAKGADQISFSVGPGADLSALTEGLHGVPLHFRAGDHGLAVLQAIAELVKTRPLRGTLDLCPVPCAQEAAPLGKAVVAASPGFHPFAARCDRFAEAGATTVQELGFGLAQAVEILSLLTDAGWSVEQALRSLFLSFSTGPNYFFEIAKLRAARMCWSQITQSYGIADDSAVRPLIHCRTALWDKTIYDPYVNLLRAATEAMSAALGGADSVAVGPFDETFRPADDFSRRLARNTQIILKKEAMLDKVIDPAGGSYYVEWLTGALAREAWKLLQRVESEGGFLKAEAWVWRQVEQSRQSREAAVASRRRTIVGTNQYPNLEEKMLAEIKTPAAGWRAAALFEQIRLRTERHAAAGGKTPKFLLAEMGDLKMRKARSGFSANFFGCAGFEVLARYFETPEQAAAEAKTCGADAVVLCSSDPEYPALAPPLCRLLGSTPVIVAGYPKDAVEQLEAAGVAGFIHIRSNAAETLAAWQQKLGVKG